jgi:putative acetyltransferase
VRELAALGRCVERGACVRGFSLREAVAADAPAIRTVVLTVLAEYGLSPSPSSTDADLDDIIGSYAGRGGLFRVIASSSDAVVGCGGLYPVDREEAEIRKMYLLKEARGHGLGRMLLNDLIAAARERGFERVVAETASVLKEAIALYKSSGFVPYPRANLPSRCDQAFVLALTTGAR